MKRTPMRRKSRKKISYEASKEGKEDAAYLEAVRCLDCCACRRYGPSEAHHCRDLPDYADQHIYTLIPGASMRSSHRDAIPLCPGCHRMFHLFRSDFHAKYGKDYRLIPLIRAEVADMELDF